MYTKYIIGEEMRYLKYLLMVLVLLLQIKVNADNVCTTNEMENLKYLANKVEFTYDYDWVEYKVNESGDISRYPEFTIHVSNLNDNLKVMIENDYLKNDYKEFENNGDGIGKISGFHDGETINVVIRAYTNSDCIGNLITVKKIQLPYLNSFYDSEICSKYNDFTYCKQFVEKKISIDEFINEFKKEYIETNKTEKIDEIDNLKTNSNINKKLIIIILTAIAIVIISLGLFKIIKHRKNGEI